MYAASTSMGVPGALDLGAGETTVLMDSEKHLRVLASIATARELRTATQRPTGEADPDTEGVVAGEFAAHEAARARARRDAGSAGGGCCEG